MKCIPIFSIYDLGKDNFIWSLYLYFPYDLGKDKFIWSLYLYFPYMIWERTNLYEVYTYIFHIWFGKGQFYMKSIPIFSIYVYDLGKDNFIWSLYLYFPYMIWERTILYEVYTYIFHIWFGKGQIYMKCIPIFSRYDLGKDKFIDFEELKRMMEKLGAPQTHLALKEMIREVDEDHDSKISFREVSRDAAYL